eukprot:Colp12_sorted_trinity150504_noHs@35892
MTFNARPPSRGIPTTSTPNESFSSTRTATRHDIIESVKGLKQLGKSSNEQLTLSLQNCSPGFLEELQSLNKELNDRKPKRGRKKASEEVTEAKKTTAESIKDLVPMLDFMEDALASADRLLNQPQPTRRLMLPSSQLPVTPDNLKALALRIKSLAHMGGTVVQLSVDNAIQIGQMYDLAYTNFKNGKTFGDLPQDLTWSEWLEQEGMPHKKTTVNIYRNVYMLSLVAPKIRFITVGDVGEVKKYAVDMIEYLRQRPSEHAKWQIREDVSIDYQSSAAPMRPGDDPTLLFNLMYPAPQLTENLKEQFDNIEIVEVKEEGKDEDMEDFVAKED